MKRLLVALLLAVLVLPLSAQRGGGFRGRMQSIFGPDQPARYDGRFMLARLYYSMFPGWSYDWPDMEQHLGSITDDLTVLRSSHARDNVLRMDDPNLLKYPVAYLSEPGFWYPTDKEVEGPPHIP